MKLVNTFKVKETEKGNTFFVLEQKQGSQGNTVWVMFTTVNDVVVGGKKVSKNLDKESRLFFKVN
tara:strand:- start:258 stop:452 length:195 start_codon:yes stop_codon:yes gene_type:complete